MASLLVCVKFPLKSKYYTITCMIIPFRNIATKHYILHPCFHCPISYYILLFFLSHFHSNTPYYILPQSVNLTSTQVLQWSRFNNIQEASRSNSSISLTLHGNVQMIHFGEVIFLKPQGFGIREMFSSCGSHKSQSLMVLGKPP
jgi:hypothetical protein